MTTITPLIVDFGTIHEMPDYLLNPKPPKDWHNITEEESAAILEQVRLTNEWMANYTFPALENMDLIIKQTQLYELEHSERIKKIYKENHIVFKINDTIHFVINEAHALYIDIKTQSIKMAVFFKNKKWKEISKETALKIGVVAVTTIILTAITTHKIFVMSTGKSFF